MYFIRMEPETGKLAALKMSPMQIRQFRLNRASETDTAWLKDTLRREGGRFNTDVEVDVDGSLVLRW
jgi:poly-gamma-glutamate synthesis protein (capsule biosynthesis protein)